MYSTFGDFLSPSQISGRLAVSLLSFWPQSLSSTVDRRTLRPVILTITISWTGSLMSWAFLQVFIIHLTFKSRRFGENFETMRFLIQVPQCLFYESKVIFSFRNNPQKGKINTFLLFKYSRFCVCKDGIINNSGWGPDSS